MSKTKIDANQVLNRNKANKKVTSNYVENLNNAGKIKLDQIEVNENNKYPMVSIEELATSIMQYGLFHDLLVKKIDENKYKLIAGERRYRALSLLVSQGHEEFNFVSVNIQDENEDEIITRIKLHEENIQARPLHKMSNEEKKEIVEDYLDLINQARNKGININGKEIKGKTKDILADLLNVSHYTAHKLIQESKKEKKVTPKEEKIEKEKKAAINKLKNVVRNGNADKKFIKEINEITKLAKEIERNKVVIDPGQTKIDDYTDK